jgi:hypothetical protein
MLGTALVFILYYVAAGLISYAAPHLLIALGIPLDQWIVTVARALPIRVGRATARWSIRLALGMALFGAATFYIARGIP